VITECGRDYEKECKPLGLQCQEYPVCQDIRQRKNLKICNSCRFYESCASKGAWQICSNYQPKS